MREMKYPSKPIFLGVIIFSLMAAILFIDGRPSSALDKWPRKDQWLYDYAHLISGDSELRINNFLRLFFVETDIEFIAVSVENLGGEEINVWTDQLFQEWKIGKRTKGHKGLLLILAEDEQQVRLEVGHDLEEVYTDGFVGYIERDQMKPFFKEGRVGEGFEATLELIVGRAWKSIERGTYLPEAELGTGGKYLSSGAGAQQHMEIGSVRQPEKSSVADEIQSRYVAQATPGETLALYLEASIRHIKDPNLGIFTDETKEFFRKWTITNAQQDNQRQFHGAPHSVKIQRNLAVIYYPDKDWTYNPFFLRKGPEGWQLDFVAMSQLIRFNHRNQWHFVSRDHPYMFAFSGYYIDKNGFVWFKKR